MSAQQPPCPQPRRQGAPGACHRMEQWQAKGGRPRRASPRARVSLRTTLPRRPRGKGDVVVGVRLCR